MKNNNIKERISQEIESINKTLRNDMSPADHRYARGVKIGLETSLNIIIEEEQQPKISTFTDEFRL